MPILRQENMFKPSSNAMNHWNDFIPARDRQRAARAKIILHVHHNQRVAARDLHVQLLCPVLQLDWTFRMPAIHRILPALLLLGCSSLAVAQFSGPRPVIPPPPKPVQIPLPPLATQKALAQAPPVTYDDPCEANAAKVDFDTCYANEFKQVDQDLNRLYRGAILAFEADIVDAHKRSDSGQLTYDSTAIGNLKATQAEWAKYRDLQCNAAGQQLQGGSIQPIVINRCMILVTRHRIDDIRAAYAIGGRTIE
jgi:uncharacterized protein YecT (DUF1311 family)